jgi:hypothetical protein
MNINYKRTDNGVQSYIKEIKKIHDSIIHHIKKYNTLIRNLNHISNHVYNNTSNDYSYLMIKDSKHEKICSENKKQDCLEKLNNYITEKKMY